MTIISSGCKWAGRTEPTAAESRVPRTSGVAPGQERLTFAGGHETLVMTGEPWPSGPGPGTADDLHDGLRCPAEDDAWLRPGFQDEDWAGVRTVDHDDARVSPEPPPPVRRNSRLHPQRTWCSACGARRQHRRPDRGRPLHGDAGAHGTSDRTPRRPAEARPALRRPGPGQALDPARPGTRRGRHRPGLHPGDAGVGRSPSSCSGAPSRAGGCRSTTNQVRGQHSYRCADLTQDPLFAFGEDLSCTAVHDSDPTIQNPLSRPRGRCGPR